MDISYQIDSPVSWDDTTNEIEKRRGPCLQSLKWTIEPEVSKKPWLCVVEINGNHDPLTRKFIRRLT